MTLIIICFNICVGLPINERSLYIRAEFNISKIANTIAQSLSRNEKKYATKVCFSVFYQIPPLSFKPSLNFSACAQRIIASHASIIVWMWHRWNLLHAFVTGSNDIRQTHWPKTHLLLSGRRKLFCAYSVVLGADFYFYLIHRSWTKCTPYWIQFGLLRTRDDITASPKNCTICPPWPWNISRSTWSPSYHRSLISIDF